MEDYENFSYLIAVQNDRVYLVDHDKLSPPSPRVSRDWLELVEKLCSNSQESL